MTQTQCLCLRWSPMFKQNDRRMRAGLGYYSLGLIWIQAEICGLSYIPS